MKYRKKQSGFTLIELVIVIVILGILAATAAPKFIDLQGDARGATFQAVKASVESATAIVHAKALIKNQTAATGTVTVNGSDIGVTDSWPDNATDTWDELLELDDTFRAATDRTTGSNGRIVWYPDDGSDALSVTQAIAAKCYVLYNEGTNSNTKPAIVIDIENCK